jgi:putative ABC transport system permease protein
VAYLTIFHRLILRPLWRESVRTVLTIAAVALGVAVVLAIELAGEAAAGSFRSSVETLAGSGDFEVTATGGVPAAALDPPGAASVCAQAQAAHRRLRRRRRHQSRSAVHRSRHAGATHPRPTRRNTGASEFQRGDFIWVGKEAGWKPGDRVRLIVNDESAEYTVRGIVDGAGDAIVTDLAPAARLLRRGTMLDRILVDVPASRPLEQWEAILRTALPDGVTLAPQGARTEENRRMLAAFRWNLRVLSYIALVVGAFLIYNTISVSVVRRREEIGIMRALGATRFGVLGAFLLEAACLGLAGGIAGVALGRLDGHRIRTPGGRYRRVALCFEYTRAHRADMGRGAGGHRHRRPGIGGFRGSHQRGKLHGWRPWKRWPAAAATTTSACTSGATWRAARRLPWPPGGPPVNRRRRQASIWLPRRSTHDRRIGAGDPRADLGGFARHRRRVAGRVFGVEALLASRSLAGSLRRTAVLVGALSTAIAMLSAVGIMVGSFRQTVLLWMEDRLQADLYLRPAGPPGRPPPDARADIAARLEALPEVAAIDQFRAYEISYQGMPATLGGGDARIAGTLRPAGRSLRRTPGGGLRPTPRPRPGHRQRSIRQQARREARRHAGTPLGGRRVRFRVIDVYGDYSNERGYIVMDRGTLLKYLPDPAPSNVAVYLRRAPPWKMDAAPWRPRWPGASNGLHQPLAARRGDARF